MGSKFRLQQVSLTLTPDNDLSAEKSTNPLGSNSKFCGDGKTLEGDLEDNGTNIE